MMGYIPWIIVLMVMTGMTVHGQPMTGSVSSWEGEFVLNPNHIMIRVSDRPPLTMCLFTLKSGSTGTAIGFSNEDGDMILAPHPQEKGVQPIYQNYVVIFTANGVAEIVVIYKVQGNGGQTYVEKYEYDGKRITLMSNSLQGGRHDSVWHKEE